MLCPLLCSPSSSLLSFSLFLHFDIFIFKKKKQPKIYSNPLSLRSVLSSLCSPPYSSSLILHSLHHLTPFHSLLFFSFVFHLPPRPRVWLITTLALSLLLSIYLCCFFPVWASLVLLPNGCRLQPRPFFPPWTFFESLLIKLSTLSFFFNSCWFAVKIITEIWLLEFFMIWWKVFTLLCIRALGLQQGVCELFSMAAVKTKHFCACDWFKSCCVSAQTGRFQEDFRFSHCMQMLLTNVRCGV